MIARSRDPGLLQELAGHWARRLEALPEPHQVEVMALARSYRTRGGLDKAIAVAESGIESGGPHDAELREIVRLAPLDLRRSRPTP